MKPFAVLLACVMLTAAATGAAQQSRFAGRWLETNPVNLLMVLHIEPDGTVHEFMPTPNSVTYRVEKDRLIATGSDQSVLTCTRKGDTLVAKGATGQLLFVRPPGNAVKDKNDLRGTWAQVVSNEHPILAIFTFRSDGQVIMEASLRAMAAKLDGDMVTLHDVRYTLRLNQDALSLDAAGKSRAFVRRPWGCLGEKFDNQAAECK